MQKFCSCLIGILIHSCGGKNKLGRGPDLYRPGLSSRGSGGWMSLGTGGCSVAEKMSIPCRTIIVGRGFLLSPEP